MASSASIRNNSAQASGFADLNIVYRGGRAAGILAAFWMKKTLMIAIPLVLIVLVAVGVGSYNAMQKVQTLPGNSIKIIREAVNKHDAETVNRLVDIDSILNTAAEEIITEYINDNTNSMTYSTQEISNRYQNLKSEFIDATKIAAAHYLKSGHTNFPADTKLDEWLRKSGVDSCVIKTYSKPVISDGVAKADVNFHNEKLKFNFELEITMRRLNENEWQIVAAKGFDSYYNAVERALKIQLESLNIPIKDQIAETFAFKTFKAVVTEGDEYGFSKTLKLTLDADISSKKPLDKIIGRVIIDGRDGRAGITPFEIDMTDKLQGQQEIEINKILNPFVKQDSDVMRHGLKKSAIHIEVTEIVYLDGTRLKQIDELPEEENFYGE